MRAMLMTAAGGPEVLQWADVPEPTLSHPTQVKVRLRAAGVNPIDTKLRARGGSIPTPCRPSSAATGRAKWSRPERSLAMTFWESMIGAVLQSALSDSLMPAKGMSRAFQSRPSPLSASMATPSQ